jgi:hypothetical protein
LKKVYRRKTGGKKPAGQRKRSQSDVGRAKNDLKRFATLNTLKPTAFPLQIKLNHPPQYAKILKASNPTNMFFITPLLRKELK